MGNAVVPPDDPRHPILRLPGATRVPAGPTHDGDGLTLISFLLARSPLVSRPSHMPWLWSLPQIPSPPWCSTKIRRIPVPPALVGSTRLCLFPKSPRKKKIPSKSWPAFPSSPPLLHVWHHHQPACRSWRPPPAMDLQPDAIVVLQFSPAATNGRPPCYKRLSALLQKVADTATAPPAVL
jgi:hypothetical protein